MTWLVALSGHRNLKKTKNKNNLMRESVGEPVLSFFACWGMHVETLHVISTSLSALCLLVSPIQHLHQSQHLVFLARVPKLF